MATLAEVKRYLEAPPLGKPVPLSEMKVLDATARQELCDSLDALSAEERERF